jgi:hypothetical protein
MMRIVAQSSPMNWDGFTALRGDPSKQIRKPGAFRRVTAEAPVVLTVDGQAANVLTVSVQ